MAAKQATRGEAPAAAPFPIDQLCFDLRNPRLFLDVNQDEDGLIERLWKEFVVDLRNLRVVTKRVNGDHEYGASRDDRHEIASSYWRMVADFWRTAGHLRASRGHVMV